MISRKQDLLFRKDSSVFAPGPAAFAMVHGRAHNKEHSSVKFKDQTPLSELISASQHVR